MILPTSESPRSCSAFAGSKCIASGSTTEVALAVKQAQDAGEQSLVLVFDDETSRQIEFDLRGTDEEVSARLVTAAALDPAPKRGPGRPKLGVVAREVTLLPRHWDWLNEQPGGASVALRKLVEEARRSGKDGLRHAQEAVHRFMFATAGDLPGFEEASRAFYANDFAKMELLTSPWPADLRNHLGKLTARVREASGG